MTSKELSQLYFLNREIQAEKNRLRELEALAEGCTARITGLPHVGGPNSKIENYAILISEQNDLINLKIKQSVIEYNRLTRFISDVEDSQMRMILQLRHVNGLSWRQVAEHIGGGNTAGSVRKAHDRFLQKN